MLIKFAITVYKHIHKKKLSSLSLCHECNIYVYTILQIVIVFNLVF